MKTPIVSYPTSANELVVKASTYLQPIAESTVNPAIEFINRNSRTTKPVSSFADFSMYLPEKSYMVSHGAVGHYLDVVSK